MNELDGFNELIKHGNRDYHDSKSHSYIKEFIVTIPKQEVKEFVGIPPKEEPPFIKDELKWDGTIYLPPKQR